MAKMTSKKRVKRRITFTGFCFCLMVFSIIVSLGMSLFVRTRNNSLIMEIQEANAEIAALKNENRSLTIEIQSLENRDRVYMMAESAGLNQNQNNIISIGD